MSKTNCINCGAAKEASDLQCPFCGTKYIDMATLDLFHDDTLYLQFMKGDRPITAKAYITSKTLTIHPSYMDISSVDGTRNHLTVANNVSGTIDFTLYESI